MMHNNKNNNTGLDNRLAETDQEKLCAGAVDCGWFSFGRRRQQQQRTQQAEAPEDKLSAKELYELSPDARNQLLEEIHGVLEIPEEDPELVENSLERMEEEIKRVTKRGAYKKALFLNPSYVASRSFRIMFLRNAKFDACVAANQIIQHFENKAELFGEDKVAKKITMDDLDEDDMECLMSGCRQILPTKDRAGRTVMFHDMKFNVCKTWKAEMKALWYLFSVALEDEDTQKLGIVNVSYEMGAGEMTKKKSFTKFILNVHLLRDGLPIRTVATHFCYDSNVTWPLVMLLRTVAGKRVRLRFRDHFGSHLECQYALDSYGIHNLPLDDTGWQSKGMFLKWIEERRRIEAEELERTTKNNIVTPFKNDILVGRGRPFQAHTGNSRLLILQKEKFPSHMRGTPAQRDAICKEVVHIVAREWGGQFLEREESTGMWIVLDDTMALEKVSNGFRAIKKTWKGDKGLGEKAMEVSERSDKRQRLESPIQKVQ